MSHVTYINGSWHTHECTMYFTCETWVMAHTRMHHVSHVQVFCHMFQWVMSHIWMSHVTYMNESWHTHECTMFHMCKCFVTYMNESCHTYGWVISHIWMSHVTHMIEIWHTYEWVMSHIWLMHVAHMNESCHTYEWVMSHIWTSHIARMNESRHTYEWVMSHVWISHVTQKKCVQRANEALVLNIKGSTWVTRPTNEHLSHTPYQRARHMYLQTEEIGLKIITTAKISNKFSRESPYISNTFHGSSQNFKQIFTWVNGVPGTQKIYQEN